MVLEFISVVALVATLLAVFTSLTLWIGLGFLAFTILSIVASKYILRNDHSGDGGIAYAFAVVFPSTIISITMLLAAGIRGLVLFIK